MWTKAWLILQPSHIDNSRHLLFFFLCLCLSSSLCGCGSPHITTEVDMQTKAWLSDHHISTVFRICFFLCLCISVSISLLPLFSSLCGWGSPHITTEVDVDMQTKAWLIVQPSHIDNSKDLLCFFLCLCISVSISLLLLKSICRLKLD